MADSLFVHVIDRLQDLSENFLSDHFVIAPKIVYELEHLFASHQFHDRVYLTLKGIYIELMHFDDVFVQQFPVIGELSFNILHGFFVSCPDDFYGELFFSCQLDSPKNNTNLSLAELFFYIVIVVDPDRVYRIDVLAFQLFGTFFFFFLLVLGLFLESVKHIFLG